MQFVQTPLAGCFLLDISPVQDERGFFARTVCQAEFAEHGLDGSFVQQSISWNPLPGTLRGLHFQLPPYAEAKLVRVTSGAIFDVIVDLRPESPTFGNSFHTELTAANRRQLYIAAGCAHGFQSLQAGTEVLYQMTVPFKAGQGRGLRWDDPALDIPWPATTTRLVSAQDQAWPLFSKEHFQTSQERLAP